jgi:hypothetical protein
MRPRGCEPALLLVLTIINLVASGAARSAR